MKFNKQINTEVKKNFELSPRKQILKRLLPLMYKQVLILQTNIKRIEDILDA